MSELLTASVQRYYQNSRLLADWQLQDGISVEFPKPIIRVEDQGFQTTLENVGHGLQRASLFAVIQFLAERAMASKSEASFDEAQSDIILLVEEPEIYQHPNKQQVISEAFHSICRDFSKSTGIRFQIIFTTHSEKFVGLHKFQAARVLRRMEGFNDSSHTAKGISLGECSAFFASLQGIEPMPNATFEAKMHIFSREVCEGFFADKVLLVEGVTDKAVMEGLYRSQGINVAEEGIAIVAVDGKSKIDKPLHIFSKLGIPTYPVFDSDQSKNAQNQRPQTNRLIQEVLGVPQPQDFPDGVFPNFAAFSCNLEKYLKAQIGDAQYEQLFLNLTEDFGLSRKELCKTPVVVNQIVHRAIDEFGIEFPYLTGIVSSVDQIS
ncbi:ATP-dependent nuclease [Loktanella sp. Alg231-35]|uniref:ATP-dependent nuclease n=1 Tax=Loktanella sp. Alg231-35 TaxID=1922220 RepID=UPI00131F130B|nr:TOPRIM nucleotidyl transferase/hydrolase domain-containing protein [Loktanella sp. Alg231-35]